MNKKHALHLSLAFGFAQFALGCSDAGPVSEPVETTDVARAETQQPNEPDKVETPLPSTEKATVSRSAESHVHGGATLSVVSEKGAIFIELETPLYNLIGFEYAPQTDEEKAKVLDVEQRLAQPKELFKFNAEAKCTYNTPAKAVDLFPKEAESHSEHHDHDDENKEGHDHEDGHDHDHENGKDHKNAHADITVGYTATCDNLEALRTIEVLFFEDFTNMAEVELVYLGPSQQMGAELLPSKPIADLVR